MLRKGEIMKFFKKIFDHEYKELERFRSISDKIMELDNEYSNLSYKQLQAKTPDFKDRLAKR